VRGVPRRLSAFLRGKDLRPDQLDGGREIRLVGLIVAAGLASASVFHVVYALVVKWRYPYFTFLYNPHRTFMDFIDVWNAVIVYGPSERHSVTVYSPFSHLVLTLLTHVPAVIVFTAMNVGFCITLALVLWRGVTRRIGNRRLRWIYVAVFSFLSYPVLFALQLGNIELVMFILLAAFVYLYYEKRSAWAWFPLSVAVAGKYWYAVFLVALVWDRRWRDVAYCAVGAVAANLGSVFILARLSGFTFGQVLQNAARTLGDFVRINTDIHILVQHGHTAWGAIQVVDMWLGFPLIRNPLASTLYVPLALAVFALVALRLDKARRPPWLGFTALLVCGMLFPYQGHDYTAIHLFLPLALLGAHGVQAKGGTLVAVLFGLMLIPMSYGVIVFDVTVSVLIYPLVLGTLLVTVVRVAQERELIAFGDGSKAECSWRLELRPALMEGDSPLDSGHGT
jgi:Glycosyltransferase family 87